MSNFELIFQLFVYTVVFTSIFVSIYLLINTKPKTISFTKTIFVAWDEFNPIKSGLKNSFIYSRLTNQDRPNVGDIYKMVSNYKMQVVEQSCNQKLSDKDINESIDILVTYVWYAGSYTIIKFKQI